MLLVALHYPALHRLVLVGHEAIRRQVRVIRIVFGNKVTARRLHDVAGHQGARVVVALQHAVRQVSFDLQTKQKSGELLLQLARIGCVEFDAEPEHRFDQ